jgi:hypothetical protein
MTTNNDIFDQAASGLKLYFNAHNLIPWEPDINLSGYNARCVYLRGKSKQLAKWDRRLGCVAEYATPGQKPVRDVARRADDIGEKKFISQKAR